MLEWALHSASCCNTICSVRFLIGKNQLYIYIYVTETVKTEHVGTKYTPDHFSVLEQNIYILLLA